MLLPYHVRMFLSRVCTLVGAAAALVALWALVADQALGTDTLWISGIAVAVFFSAVVVAFVAYFLD
ncbi:MAG: hypothetical protein J0I48_19105 [Devosia sp.]|uniref:hypothetical protein n=1 Tax=Devosia sp. 66-22 TaxID=1895753 RepID=UPI000929DF95|nr:hypothetical protein [Devosia sp. 66-22]MBN9348275.1 hypothetical protein [Devosia sp.]OJX48984.1 MAG: hypothetical protein BGO81_10340 [Devosia sp. 66-22]